MESRYNEIDDLFRDELSEHTEVPPPRVWSALEQRLDKDKKRRVFPFRWYWFVGLLFFITVLAGYFAWTGGSEGVDGGAAMNVAGASVTAPAASDRNAVLPVKNNERVSVNRDTENGVAEKPGDRKNEEKRSTYRKSNRIGKEKIAKDVAHERAEEVKPTANAPTVGTSMYSYDEFDEPEEPRNEEVAASGGRQQYASAVPGGRHKIAVVELPEALNESLVEPTKSVAVATLSEEKAPDATDERSEKKVAQRDQNITVHRKAKYAKAYAVANAKKTNEPATTALAAGTPPAGLSSVANNKSSVAEPKIVAKEVATTTSENRVNARGSASTQPADMPAAAAGAKGVASQMTSVQEVAAVVSEESAKVKQSLAAKTKKESVTNKVAETSVRGKDDVVKKETLVSAKMAVRVDVPKVAEKGSLPVAVAGSVLAKNEVATNRKSDKEKAKLPTEAKQAGAGHEVQLAKDVPSIGKHRAAREKAESQRQEAKVEAEKGGVAKRGSASGKGAVAAKGEDELTQGTGSPVAKVAGKGKVNSGSMVAANVPVVKAKPVAEANVGGKPAIGKQEVDEKTTDSVQEAKALQAAKSESAKKVELTKQSGAIDSMVALGKQEDSAADKMSKLTKWAVGLKGGFEMALVGAGSSKVAVSPFVQYRLGKRFSIMVQPAIKGVRQRVRTVGTPGNYFESKSGTGGYRLVDSALLYLVMTGDTLWRRNYEYTEKYDSIVKTYKTGGTYLEFELPLLLRFDVTPKLGVYGGVNMVYSKRQGVREETTVWSDQLAKGQASTLLAVTAPAVLPTTTGLNYTGTPLANYAGPVYPDDRSGLMRMGYMLGVSYEFKKRWLADAMLQQSFVPANVQGGTDLNKPFGLPYIRLTIGYRFGDK
ncbi:MAG: hypothetical protein JNM41_03230 [Flavipsychrobacter sp.]|nr:hypothetical protein [Flavipsychrobacter sp.]